VTDSDGSSEGGTVRGVLRAVGALLGVHIQYARREAATDIGRMVAGIVLLVLAVIIALFALALGHGALVIYLKDATRLTLWGAVLSVAGGDMLLALALLLLGRSRLKRPIMVQTRTLVKKTVTSMSDL